MIDVDGAVFRPGEPGYDTGRDGFQLAGRHRPEVVVAAAGAADARPRRLVPGDELFGALLGGDELFGVVTGMEIGLVPVTRLYGGGLYFPASAEIVAAWRDWTATVPDGLTSAVGLIPVPDVPEAPGPLRGRHVAHVRIAHLGEAAEGDRIVAPLRAAGPVLADTLRELPFTESASISNDPEAAHAYAGTGVLLDGLDPAAAFGLADPGAEVPCIVQVRHLGGALAGPSPALVGHRDARYVLHVVTPLDGRDPGAVRAAHRSLAGTLKGAGTFLNFQYGPATAEQVRAAYDPGAYRELVRLKKAYDPANLFRFNHNVPPAG
ncbi:FAD-binding protein [Planomonospora sphaerica]|uniref:FAD-binding protein n=1 Tax=Planomonospora sphaerica TaxID=161355 RepID=A0A171DNA1_9ACTN|nr:BBE domain-containing protein [Planomonospora sphaerica]GAT70546.1 FAD-binding protein [Planomonospora sphaerica]